MRHLISIIIFFSIIPSTSFGNEGLCKFRKISINTEVHGTLYHVGRSNFREFEVRQLSSIFEKYGINVTVVKIKSSFNLMIPCNSYNDFDLLHNLTKKSKVK